MSGAIPPLPLYDLHGVDMEIKIDFLCFLYLIKTDCSQSENWKVFNTFFFFYVNTNGRDRIQS